MKARLKVNNKNIMKIINRLSINYKNAATELQYENNFQLLIAVILSAQCTDRKVNEVTGRLFKKYKTAEDFALLSPEELAEDIKDCGLYRNKSRFIVETARELVKNYGSEVPNSRPDLEKLPGVGRKSAGVILNEAFKQNTIPVDTHVYRVAHRLGLAKSRTPLGTEKELKEVIPERYWHDMHHWLIQHGRKVCRARSPRCSDCFLQNYCLKSNCTANNSGRRIK